MSGNQYTSKSCTSRFRDAETVKKVMRLKRLNPSMGYRAIAKNLGITVNVSRMILADNNVLKKHRKYRERMDRMPEAVKTNPDYLGDGVSDRASKSMEIDEGTDSCIITSRSDNIKTLDAALKAARVDLNKWIVDRHTINCWEVTLGGKGNNPAEKVTNWQVKVFLKSKVIHSAESIIESLIDRLNIKKKFLPPIKPESKKEKQYAVLMTLYDHHFGKLAWPSETGEDYNLHIAKDLYLKAVNNLLESASGFPIEKIYLPIGQDFFHINSGANTTAAGTPQDVDGRIAKVFSMGCETIIESVDLCSRVAPTEVMYVPGNHDPETSFYLIKVIEAYYRENPRIQVDSEPTCRKYRQYGTVLFGTTHGNEEAHRDLPVIMAAEVPEMWSKTTHREWFLGHFHKKKETKFSSGDTFGGVTVRILPSLSGTDAWHYKKGYIKNNRAAELYVWHKEDGYVGHFSSNIKRANKGY